MKSRIRRASAPVTLTFFTIWSVADVLGQEDSKSVTPPASVIVTRAIEKDIRPSISFSGRVEAIDKVELRARVDGFLEKKLFTDGQDVKAGDLLFVMEKGQYEAAVAQALGAVESDKSSLGLANIEVDRQRGLVAKGAAAQSRLDFVVAEQQGATGSLAQSQAALDKTKLDLGYTDIRAPIAGRIGRSQYSVGNFVGPSSKALATLAGR